MQPDIVQKSPACLVQLEQKPAPDPFWDCARMRGSLISAQSVLQYAGSLANNFNEPKLSFTRRGLLFKIMSRGDQQENILV
jgi:hypothetical protein